jgi:hypothetical protein
METEFKIGEVIIANENIIKDLPMRVGQRAIIWDNYTLTKNFDYVIEFDDGEKSPARICELNKLTEQDKLYMDYIFKYNIVKYHDEKVLIVKCDYLHNKAEIKIGEVEQVVDFEELQPIEYVEQAINTNYFEQKGLEIGQLVNKKQKAYGDSISKAYKLMQVYLENYDNGDDTYTIPKSLLKHILLQVRIIDKQNRIFNNPDGDLMEENPYADTVGYSLLGMRMCDEN